MTALKDRIQTAANSVKTGKALIENSIVSKGGSVTKVNPIPTFAELCGGVNNLYKIKITVSRETITFPDLGGLVEVTINSSTVVEVTVPNGITIQSNQYPFMGEPRRSYGATKFVFSRIGWSTETLFEGDIIIRALVSDVVIEKRLHCTQAITSAVLYGFEYAPDQADDRVDYIGNAVANQNRTLPSLMRPFEEKIDGTDKAYLQDNVKLRIDGSPSHLTNPDYLQKVEIPEFWYGYRYDSHRNKNQVWFSRVAVHGYMHIAPQALCRYPGYVDGAGFARSYSGCNYVQLVSFPSYSRAAQKTSSDLFVMSYYLWNALVLLLVYDMGRRNPSEIYRGLVNVESTDDLNSGKTDILTTPSGEVPPDDQTRDSKSFRWRFIENLYANRIHYLSGVYGKDEKIYVCPNPYLSNTNGIVDANYFYAHPAKKMGAGWIKEVQLPWIFAKSTGGSSTTHFAGYCYDIGVSGPYILLGGGYSRYYPSLFTMQPTGGNNSVGWPWNACFASITRAAAATQVVVSSPEV